MNTLLWLTVALTLLVSASAVPIPEQHAEGFFVATVNKTAVCVVNRSVYQDGERLPMEDPCEICRCRPPGFACAFVRCSKKDPKPGCNIVDLVGQCCPQYRCEAPKQPEGSSIKPDVKDEDPLLLKEEDPIDGKLDNVDNPSSEASVDGHAAILASSTASLDLDQRAAEESLISSSSKPADEELGKSLEESSSAAPEIPREERVETNEVLADDANVNASESEEGGRSELISTLNPVGAENVDFRSQEGTKLAPLPTVLLQSDSKLEEEGEKASVAPLWKEELPSTLAPEKIERKEDLAEGSSSAAPLLLGVELRRAEEQQSSLSPLADEKIELSAASSEPSLLIEKSVDDKNNATLLDEPKIATLPVKEEKLDITILKGDKLREKRETIEINPATSEPQATEAEIKEKSGELLPEINLEQKELQNEALEVEPSSKAPVDKILIAETLSSDPKEKLIVPLADEAQLPEDSSSSAKP